MILKYLGKLAFLTVVSLTYVVQHQTEILLTKAASRQ